jgi:hypothetical protein
MSGAYVTQPLLTVPADAAHFEHAKYKRTARAFVFNNWRRSWMLLRGTALTTVPLHVYSVGADGGNDTDCIEALGAMSSGSSASMLGHNSERRAERTTRRHRSGGSSSPSALLLPGAWRLGLPAHVQVLDVTIDSATERALRLAAVGLRDDGTLQAGAPAYALVLPLPFLLLQSVPNATSELLRSALLLIDRMKREETNFTAINAAIQSPSTSSGSLGEKKGKRSDPVPRVGTPDVTLLTLRGSIGMTADPVPSLRRKARLQLFRQLSCLMGHGAHTEEAGANTDTQSDAWLQALRGAERPAAIGHTEGLSEHPRNGSEITSEISAHTAVADGDPRRRPSRRSPLPRAHRLRRRQTPPMRRPTARRRCRRRPPSRRSHNGSRSQTGASACRACFEVEHQRKAKTYPRPSERRKAKTYPRPSERALWANGTNNLRDAVTGAMTGSADGKKCA